MFRAGRKQDSATAVLPFRSIPWAHIYRALQCRVLVPPSEASGEEVRKKKRECCAKRPRVLLPFHIAAIVVCYAATRDAICVQRVFGRAQNVAEKTGRNNGSFNYCSVFLKWRAQLFSDAIGVRI